MDWVIEVELQFSDELHLPKELFTEAERRLGTIDMARSHARDLLDVCIQEHYLSHYQLLSEPRQVDS